MIYQFYLTKTIQGIQAGDTNPALYLLNGLTSMEDKYLSYSFHTDSI